MKKGLKIFLIVTAVIVLLILCFPWVYLFIDEGVESIKIERYQAQYMKACEKDDFVTAHQAVDRISTISKSAAEEAQKYVNTREITYLICQGGEINVNRILVLLKNGECTMEIDDIAELAVTMKNDYLLQGLSLAYPSIMDNSVVESYYFSNSPSDYQSFLRERINKLKIKTIDGTKIPAGNRGDAFRLYEICVAKSGMYRVTEEIMPYYTYYNSTVDYNNSCIQILHKAIAIKDFQLAKEVINLIKDDIEIDSKTGVKYTHRTKNEANEILNEAKNSGLFM